MWIIEVVNIKLIHGKTCVVVFVNTYIIANKITIFSLYFFHFCSGKLNPAEAANFILEVLFAVGILAGNSLWLFMAIDILSFLTLEYFNPNEAIHV